jgi:hypothetical protein
VETGKEPSSQSHMQARSNSSCQVTLPTKEIQHTRFAVQPRSTGSLNDRDSGSMFLPRMQLMAIGMPYETPRATTEADMIALNALELSQLLISMNIVE